MKPHCTLPMTWSARATGGLLGALMIITAAAPALIAAEMPVSAVQETLKREQFFYGETSGVFDEPTRAALRRFQIRYGLPVSGEIDAATIKVLKDPREKDTAAAPATPATAPKAPTPATGATGEKDREFLRDLQQSGTAPEKAAVAPPSAPMAAPAARSTASETVEKDFAGTGTARIITRRGVIEDETAEPPPRSPAPGETVRRVTRTTTTTAPGAVETDDDADPLAPNGVRIIRPPAPGSVPSPDGQKRVIEETRTTTTTTGSAATPQPARAPSPGSGLPFYPQADEPPSRLVPEPPPRRPQGFFQRLFRGDR